MYSYEWDKETGGYILLPSKILGVSKEVRPVYAEELKILRLDLDYNWAIPDTELPLLWAEFRRYFYRGELVFETVGGGLYERPLLKNVVANLSLEPVNIPEMLARNEALMEGLVQTTLKQIYDIFNQYRYSVDYCYAAFSGGKDSVVMLDLVQRALPHDQFGVIFGDTTMELSDTYKTVDVARKRWNDLEWNSAKTDFDSKESWRRIGPPARTIRWCCSVHKSAPSILKIKEILSAKKKCEINDIKHFKILAFLGVRKEESEARSNYTMVADGNKHAVQINCNPILEWSTSELFLYIFHNGLPLNPAYKKGLSRVGCMLCPMSPSWTDFIQKQCYEQEVQPYIDIIKETIDKKFETEEEWKSYMMDGGWKKRAGGKILSISEDKVSIISSKDREKIVIKHPNYPWNKWMRTLGELIEVAENKYSIKHGDVSLTFDVEEKENMTILSYIPLAKDKSSIRFMYLFKNAINKGAYCVNCQECMVECPNSALTITQRDILIEGCKHCEKCLDRQRGCIAARSLMGKGLNNMDAKNIDRYRTFGIRQEWVEAYFEDIEEFWTNDRLGKDMYTAFEKWGKEIGLIDSNNNPMPYINKLIACGSDSPFLWGFFYANMAYNSPVVTWYIRNVQRNHTYSPDNLVIMLGDELKERTRKNALTSLYNTMKASPIGEPWGLGQGELEFKGKTIIGITKGMWYEPNPIVILYTLYLFAEHMDGLYSFTLSDLLDDSDEREAMSPRLIFGIEPDVLKPILQGLANDYGDYIQVDFNKGIMENIDLPAGKKGMKAIDVLKLV